MKICIHCNTKKELDNFHKKETWKFWVHTICKKCMKIKANKYYLNNKSKILKQSECYYYNNINKISKRRAIHRKENPELYKKRYIEYYNSERGKEIYRLNNSKRRALKITTSDWTINIESTTELLDKQWWVCNYCWIDITDRKVRHLDHIHPLSKGGVHSINNVQWLCSDCNLSKWAHII